MQTDEQRLRRNEMQRLRRARDPERARAHDKAYRAKHPEKVKEHNRKGQERLGKDYWIKWQQARRVVVLERYGTHCACCGETEFAFLTIDHINGGGHQERLAIGSNGVFKKLFTSPERLPGYRVLCMNCQFGYRFNRVCPHQQGVAQAA